MIFSNSSGRRFEPKQCDEAMLFAEAVVKSGMLPHLKSKESAFAILVMGAELGISAMRSLRSIYLVDGKPMLSADLTVGLVKRSPLCQWFRLVGSSMTETTYETFRVGDPGPTRYTYTLKDAQTARLTRRRSWRLYPAAMLRARCAAGLAKRVYPDLTAGLIPTIQDPGGSWLRHPTTPPQGVDNLHQLQPLGTPASPTFKDFPDDPSYHKLRKLRARKLIGMSTLDAARLIASALVDQGLASNTNDAMQFMVKTVEAAGLQPHKATLDHLLSAWLELDPPSEPQALAA